MILKPKDNDRLMDLIHFSLLYDIIPNFKYYSKNSKIRLAFAKKIESDHLVSFKIISDDPYYNEEQQVQMIELLDASEIYNKGITVADLYKLTWKDFNSFWNALTLDTSNLYIFYVDSLNKNEDCMILNEDTFQKYLTYLNNRICDVRFLKDADIEELQKYFGIDVSLFNENKNCIISAFDASNENKNYPTMFYEYHRITENNTWELIKMFNIEILLNGTSLDRPEILQNLEFFGKSFDVSEDGSTIVITGFDANSNKEIIYTFYRANLSTSFTYLHSTYLEEDENNEEDEYSLSKWQKFCENVKHKARYFDHEDFSVSETLEDFNDFFEQIVFYSSDKVIYRARKIDKDKDREDIEADPDKELGSVPIEYAKNNRFSPIGISYGYFAFEVDTVLKEIRATISDEVAIGVFNLNNGLRIIDFRSVTMNEKFLNYFDDNFNEKFYCISHFIHEFITDISKPVSDDKQLLD